MVAIGVAMMLLTHRKLRVLDRKARDGWESIHGLLSERQLVASALLDSLNHVHGESMLSERLGDAIKQASHCLQGVSETNLPHEVDEVCDSQRDLCAAIDSAVGKLSQPGVASQHDSIGGCLKGIESIEERIQIARVGFNDAATTYVVFANSTFASLVAKLSNGRTQLHLLDWDPAPSSIRSPIT